MAVLGSLVEQIRGVSYKPEDLHSDLNADSIMLLRANNIRDDMVNFDEVVYVDRKKVTDKQLLKAGDILICTSSGSKDLVGKAAYIAEDIEATFGAFCKVVRPRSQCAKYIGHFFCSPIYRERIANVAGGANINNIRNEHIDELTIPLPALAEQESISALLDSVTTLISLRKQQIAKLDELVKARFVEMFGDERLPRNTVEQLCTQIVDCPHTTPKYEGVLCNPAIRTSEIKKGYITWDTMRYVSDDEYEERTARLKPEAGDIVYGREGTFGNAAILPVGHKFCLGQRVMLLRPDYEKCTSEYMLHAIISDSVFRQALEKNNASTVAHVNVSDVKKFVIALPPIECQKQFAAFVDQTDQQKLTIQHSLAKLEMMKKALMQKYFG